VTTTGAGAATAVRRLASAATSGSALVLTSAER
jgi:hypothetical protein